MSVREHHLDKHMPQLQLKSCNQQYMAAAIASQTSLALLQSLTICQWL
jgi:hypothetical protein